MLTSDIIVTLASLGFLGLLFTVFTSPKGFCS